MASLPSPCGKRLVTTRMMRTVLSYFLLCLLSSTNNADALAPAHPLYFAEYENLPNYRRRHNITYNYSPKHYPADHCRFLSEEQCEQEDLAAGGEAVERRRQLWAPSTPSRRNGGDRALNPSTGSLKILVLLRYFPEHASIRDQLPPRSYFETLLNGKGPSAVNPVGGLAEWLHVNSLTNMNVEFVVQDWTVTKQSESYYSGGKAGRMGILWIQDIFRDELDMLYSSGLDFSQFDSNSDGYLDGVMAFHSGVPAELGEAKCAPDYLQRIWAQAARGADLEGWKSSDGMYALEAFTVSGAFTRPLCADDGTKERVYTPTHMAIHAHELGHTWNLEDYYDQTQGETGLAGIGSFDIMCNAYGWNLDGSRPGYMSTYNKIASGWMEAVEIKQDGFYAIQPIELSSMSYKISGPFPEGEYLLIESRYPYRWNDDWAGQGIVIYHVDVAAPLQTAKGYPGRSGFPASHYLLSVLQKDGKYDIEKNVNLGDEGDFWVLGDELGPGPSTWPNTDSIQGAQTQTGLKIKVTSGPGVVMQFQVSGYKEWTSRAGTGMAPAPDESAVKSSKATSTVGTSKSDAFWPANPASSSAPTLATVSVTGSPLLMATFCASTALAVSSLSL